jgi:hypothetical protein
VPNIIFRTPSEHRAVLAHARILIAQSKKLLQESLANIFVGVTCYTSVPADRGQHLKPEIGATANSRVNELIGLTHKLLRCYGWDVEDDNRISRCLVISDFFIATYSVRPDLSVFRILQRDREQNILQLFAATWHWSSGQQRSRSTSTDLGKKPSEKLAPRLSI